MSSCRSRGIVPVDHRPRDLRTASGGLLGAPDPKSTGSRLLTACKASDTTLSISSALPDRTAANEASVAVVATPNTQAGPGGSGCARKTITSTKFPTRRFPRTCWISPPISFNQKHPIFDPKKFDDRYEDALKELLRKKEAGQKIQAPQEPAPAKVINLMDALRRSVETERRPPARSASHRRAPKKAGRSNARQKKAG